MTTLIHRPTVARAIQDGRPLASVLNRCTGRSTARALEFLAHAIKNPGTQVKFTDHHTDSQYGDGAPTYQQNKELARLGRELAEKLELTDMVFTELTVTSKFAEVLS